MEASSRSRVWLFAALGVYSVALAVALLAPSSQDQSAMAGWLRDLGVDLGLDPFTATQARAEFIANALILAPVSALGSLVWRRTTWRDWTAYAFVIACAVELAQGLLLANRTPSTVDVVANTLGGLLGSAVIAVGTRLLERRPARVGGGQPRGEAGSGPTRLDHNADDRNVRSDGAPPSGETTLP